MIIKRWLNRFIKHKHSWETTHVNVWRIPIIQTCKCGLKRTANTKLAKEDLMYCWEYSDGTISEPYSLGEGTK